MLFEINSSLPHLLLALDRGEFESLAHATLEGFPLAVDALLVPGESADPGLDVVVQAELDVFELGDLAGGVGDLVLGTLVAELEDAARGREKVSILLLVLSFARLLGSRLFVARQEKEDREERGEGGGRYRLGSMLLPAALFLSFFMVAGPTLARWSELGLVMMESQMTAELVALAPAPAETSGHSAVT